MAHQSASRAIILLQQRKLAALPWGSKQNRSVGTLAAVLTDLGNPVDTGHLAFQDVVYSWELRYSRKEGGSAMAGGGGGSLRDFLGFRTMLTPYLIKVVYFLGVLAITLGCAAAIYAAYSGSDRSAPTFISMFLPQLSGSDKATAVVVIIIAWGVLNVAWRLFCESIILLFSMHEILFMIQTGGSIRARPIEAQQVSAPVTPARPTPALAPSSQWPMPATPRGETAAQLSPRQSLKDRLSNVWLGFQGWLSNPTTKRGFKYVGIGMLGAVGLALIAGLLYIVREIFL